MQKNTYILIAVIALIIAVVTGIAIFSRDNKVSEQTGTQNQTNTTPTTSAPKEIVIMYSDAGFSPSSVEIKTGDTVIFKNESEKEMWPASAFHPTHTAYPGSDINKCGTAEEGKIFDSCKGIEKGGSWSFKFDRQGEWKYHNHLMSGYFGTIIVK